ncbi:hypothetical protein [Aggregatibacter kilianii]|uniref:hypothetical protein n=1 Tax=Aggregatibacter kilianii TaxID=2025884 RepID=UPI0028D7857F|nr:hypothetical protein [Aggregatibacter kilianii]
MTTIKSYLANQNNANMVKWALVGIAQGDLNQVNGFVDLDGQAKGLISIYKAQILKAAQKAGVELSGKDLAKDFSQRIAISIKNNAVFDKKSLAESIYCVDIDSAY